MANTDKTQMRAAISPCPNDTFIFHGLVSKALTLPDTEIDWTFEDVETLNRAAIDETFDLTKLSFHAYLLVQEKYQLLRAGAALGFQCGPIAVSGRPIQKADLPSLKIAIPGELTTAHLLFRLFCPEASDKIFVRYDEIIPIVKSGQADVGVIIHEDRFVFEAAGLHLLADLGQWWEAETGTPIPLGCIAIRRTLADRYADALDALIQRSILAARKDTAAAMPFILQHAKQMDLDILQKHIRMFVNDFSLDLGSEGDRAVRMLMRMAKETGLLS